MKDKKYIRIEKRLDEKFIINTNFIYTNQEIIQK